MSTMEHGICDINTLSKELSQKISSLLSNDALRQGKNDSPIKPVNNDKMVDLVAELKDLLPSLQHLQATTESFRLEPQQTSDDVLRGDEDRLEKESEAGMSPSYSWPLTAEEYKRYGRQLIMPEIGLKGQLRLRNSRVLIIGLGGLGCPAAAYLAGAGIGHLGLMDADTVESSNLHRQIIHSRHTLGMSKVDSASIFIKSLNESISCSVMNLPVTVTNALDSIESYDIVLDCTDHPKSRYLISDACVVLGKPLVSASALRTEGQLMVLNRNPAQPGDSTGGPCYRCVFPKAPPAESVVACSDGGILGPVVGVMGVLQALETMKIIAHAAEVPSAGYLDGTAESHCMLMFSAYDRQIFRTIRLRGRRSDCAACGTNPSITRATFESASLDYARFCGVALEKSLLQDSERLSALDLAKQRKDGSDNMVLVDVREKSVFETAHLHNSVNIPWSTIARWKKIDDIHASLEHVISRNVEDDDRKHVETSDLTFICRYGNDSQLAVLKLRELVASGCGAKQWTGGSKIRDVKGGFEAWRHHVDSTWPDF